MMKCKICGEKGIIKFKAHNISLCEKCLLDFIKRRVKTVSYTHLTLPTKA